MLCVLPVSNAAVEQFFSTMKQVKTDWHSKLGEELQAFIRIKRYGHLRGLIIVELLQSATNSFFEAKPRRADTLPYGSRSKRQRINDYDSDDDSYTYSEIQYQDTAFDSD